jgi:hypothetical protein
MGDSLKNQLRLAREGTRLTVHNGTTLARYHKKVRHPN